MRRAVVTLLTILAGATAQAWAQTVRGTVANALRGAAIDGVFVPLVDAGGTERARTLTGPEGRYEIRAPAPGAYRLEVRLIGYRKLTSEPLTLHNGTTAERDLRLHPVPAVLPPVVVTGEARCGRSATAGGETGALWEQAYEALSAVAWTSRHAALSYERHFYRRELPRFGHRVLAETTWTRSGPADRPFRAAPPLVLAAHGYVLADGTRGYTLFAPDAESLLHPTFLDTHCFTVSTDHANGRQRVGLEFQPIPGRRLPDIAGTLWLDRRTLELDRLEFLFVNLPPDLSLGEAIGRLDFRRLPPGFWIVERWHIRTPRIGRRAFVDATRPPEIGVIGVQEEGGAVLDVRDGRGATVFSADWALVEGTITDRSLGDARPLAGATVRLAGTETRTTADAAGRFTLGVPIAGEYEVAYHHPRLDSLGFAPAPASVVVAPGKRTRVELAVPEAAQIFRQLCPEPPRTDTTQLVIVGTVTDAGGRALAGLPVEARWEEPHMRADLVVVAKRSGATTTDEHGRYTLCGIPARGWPVTLEARVATGTGSASVRLIPKHDRVMRGNTAHVPPAPGIWRQDLRLPAAQAPSGAITGVVRDSISGMGVDGVVVRGREADPTAVTDGAGRFTLHGLPPGPQVITFRRIGYRPHELAADVLPGDTVELAPDALVLAPAAPVLEPVTVTAERRNPHLDRSGFYERQKWGLGEFLTREKFEQWVPSNVAHVLQRLRSFRVVWQGGQVAAIQSRRTPPSVGVRGTTCPPLFFLDGVFIGKGLQALQTIPVQTLEALEAYDGGADVPPQYNQTGAACGVILFWTRRGGEEP